MRRMNLWIAAAWLFVMASPLWGATIERIDIQRSLIFVTGVGESRNYPVNTPVTITVTGKNIKIAAYVSSQDGSKAVLFSREDFSLLTYYSDVNLAFSPVQGGGAGVSAGSTENAQSQPTPRGRKSRWFLTTDMGRLNVDYMLTPQYEFNGSLHYHFDWPISVGPRVAYQIADVTALPSGYSQRNLVVGVEAMSWNPAARLGPYLGVRYDFLSQGSATVPVNDGADSKSFLYSTLGWSYFGGLIYRFGSVLSVMGGGEIGEQITTLPPGDLFSPPGANPYDQGAEYNYRSKGFFVGIMLAL